MFSSDARNCWKNSVNIIVKVNRQRFYLYKKTKPYENKL